MQLGSYRDFCSSGGVDFILNFHSASLPVF